MSKALEKIERLNDNLNADLFQLESGNGRMDDLRTMIGQIKVAIKEDYDRCIKRIKENEKIEGNSRRRVFLILSEELK